MSSEFRGEAIYAVWHTSADPSFLEYELREPIVRCRDCKHYDEVIHACDHPNVTALRGDCPENWILSCFDADFCCWGELRADA